jgi:hypothetical protein
MIRRVVALAVALALPVVAAAQQPPSPPAPPAGGLAVSGALVLQAYRNVGGVNQTDLPQWAAQGDSTTGVAVRQTRLRAALELPSDGLLRGARLSGLLEADFAGALVNADPALPQARLRHAWVSAAWKDLANLTVLAGQTWGLLEGPWSAASLGHLAVPRFGGAGVLYRRAPQLRVSVETDGTLAVAGAVAALAPIDRAASDGQLVGERAGIPDVEGRVAGRYRRGGRNVVELGLSGRVGAQRWRLDALAAPRDETITSWGAAADARVELPYVTVVSGAFLGEALGVYGSVVPGVNVTRGEGDAVSAVSPVWTTGFWAQAVVTPVAPLELLLGYGVEEPRLSDVPAKTTVGGAEVSTVTRNQQVSGGAILALTSRWRISGEVTWYLTDTYDRFERNSTQLELASIYAF